MRKKLLSALLTFAVMLTLVPLPALAADGSIDTREELVTALGNEVASLEGETVKLTKNATRSEELRINCDVTLDLNGHILDMGNTYVRVETEKKLTITDTSTQPSGKITSTNGATTIVAMRGSTLEIGAVTVENKADGYGVMLNPTPGELKTEVALEGTKVDVQEGGVYVHGKLQSGDSPVIKLTNTTIVAEGAESAGLYLAGLANTTIAGTSSVTGEMGIGIKAGTLLIKDESVITGTGNYVETPGANGNGINSSGAALEIEDHSSYAGNVKVTIQDKATLTSKNGYAVHEFIGKDGTGKVTKPEIAVSGGEFNGEKGSIKAEQDATVSVTGGSFSSKVETDDSHIAIKADDGKWTVMPLGTQSMKVRGDGVEDDTPNAKYGEAYEKAGLELLLKDTTLVIDKSKLDAVIEAGKAGQPDVENELYKVYKTLENQNNPGKLWFGMEYERPVEAAKKYAVQFDGGAFSAPTEFNNIAQTGFYNYIKVYDGTNIAGTGETAIIKWLGENDEVLAVTKAVVTIKVNDPAATPRYTVTFDKQDGSELDSVSVYSGDTVRKPADPEREGFEFEGWFKEATCTTPWDFDSDTVTEDTTLYAKWVEKGPENPDNPDNPDTPDNPDNPDNPDTPDNPDNPDNPDTPDNPDNPGNTPDTPDPGKKEYKITFNANGGTVTTTTADTKDGKLSTLPTPTRSGYTFNGWYTAASGGTKVDTSTVFDKDITLYAQWTQNSSTTSDYRVWVRSASHGDISVSTRYAERGERVTVTFEPDTNYRLDRDSVEVWRDDNGDLLTLTRDGDRYTFTMPASDVTVEAAFVRQTAYTTVYQTIDPAPSIFMPTFQPSLPTQRAAMAFPDVPRDSWAYPAAQWAYQNGYLDTDADGSFQLDGTVSHRRMWEVMAQWLGEPSMDEGEITSWALQHGAARGDVPDSAMTRNDMLVYLYKCYFLMGGDTSAAGNLASYADNRLIVGTAARNAWTWAVDRGIVTGTADGYLNPAGAVSRGEFAAILMRLCQK